MLQRVVVAAVGLVLSVSTVSAQTIFPIDRAAILAGSQFDLKVEFPTVVEAAAVAVTVNGKDLAAQFGKAPEFIAREDGAEASSIVLRGVSIDAPGRYEIVAGDGKTQRTVAWDVYAAAGPRVAKNVILFIGDGMNIASRTGARILSKGIKEGKYFGKLAMDDMPAMALIGTSGVDSIITDSANSMSAYATGHKSSVNALGVYVSRNKSNFDHPKVETIAEVVKRKLNMAVGVVSDAEVQDATPGGMVAHTRRRSDKAEITEMFLASGVDVLMGGGSAYFLPKATPGSKRKDEKDMIAAFRQAGYTLATTDEEMKKAAADPATRKLLGLYHPENMDGALDRHFLKGSTVKQYPNQPDLVDMTKTALEVLSRSPNGFVLMVEAALIDKFMHPLDWERSLYDTIMLDNAVRVAKEFAAKNNDTLILVTPDHTHGMAIVGTIDDSKPGDEMREKVGVYDQAGYPNYPPAGPDGYPARVDVSKRLAVFFTDYPDHYETWRPKTDMTFVPAVQNDKKQYVANEKYKDIPGAVLIPGNLPRAASDNVHSADDGLMTAMGPGSEMVRGFLDNTEVFRIMTNALGLGR